MSSRSLSVKVGDVTVALAALAGCGAVDTNTRSAPGGPFPLLQQTVNLPQGDLGRLFSPSAFWNTPLPDDVALDPNSRQLSAAVAGMARDLGSSLSIYNYSVPVYLVGPDQPKVKVTPGVPNPALHAAFDKVPVPDNARPASGTDAHLVVYQSSTDTLWEFWKMRREAGGWRCNYGGRMVDVSRNPGHFIDVNGPGGKPLEKAYWGATATGLPLMGGLVMPEELKRGQVDHALAIALPRIRAGVLALPAQRSDGKYSGPNSVPEGARFRIDPELDLGALGLSRAELTLARAAQRYGMVVRDGGAVVGIYARDPVNLGNDPYPALLDGLKPYQALQRFPWDALQLVKMRLRPYSG